MRSLVVSIFWIVFTPLSAFAQVSDPKQPIENSTSCEYNMSWGTGNDRSTAEGWVCKTNSSVSDRPRSVRGRSVVCTGDELTDWFYVTRIADEKKLGDFGDKLSNKACQQIVKAATPEVVCTGSEPMNWFYVTRIADGKKLGDFGDKLSLTACLQVAKAASSELVCTGSDSMDWFYLTRIADGKKLGNRLSLKTCLQLSDTGK
jgi:hypothetical protein